MEEEISIDGVAALDRKFADAGRKVATKHAKAALRDGAKVIQRIERSIAPFKTGNLRTSIQVKAGKTEADSVSVRIVPGGRWYKGNLYYAAFQNFGWFLGHRLRKFAGIRGDPSIQAKYHEASIAAGRRFIPGKFYAQRAYDAGKGQAEQVIEDRLRSMIAEDWNT